MRFRAAITLAVVAACLFVAATAAAGAYAAAGADLRKAARGLPGASGAYVYDITAGRRLLNKRGTTKRILASNTKLFTAAAALGRYGSGERFITSLWTDGVIENGELNGNVYLRGGGDPLFGGTSFVEKNFGSGATVEQLALNARVVGITRVTGRVYADESVFDDRRGTATYGYHRSGEIGGQLGGLIFNKGFIGGSYQADPPRFAAQKLRAALRAAGVPVAGGTGMQPVPPGARVLSYVESLPVSRLVRLMDKPSDNYLAEMFAKGFGMPTATLGGGTSVDPVGSAGTTATEPVLTGDPPATTRAGVDIAKRFAAGLGSQVTLGDGSGLSRTDLASPSHVVNLLRGMSGRPDFNPFNDSLPIPGVDGTLHNRMRGVPAAKRCHAKTGTLSNVSALSGYCTTAGGNLVAFSILNNRVWPGTARAAQDRIVSAIARLE